MKPAELLAEVAVAEGPESMVVSGGVVSGGGGAAAVVKDHAVPLRSELPARSLTPLLPALSVAVYVAPGPRSDIGSSVAVVVAGS